jgi:hypothetical protein
MAQKSRNVLKTYFETGDKPTQQEFGDLIDSLMNIVDDDPVQGPSGADGRTVEIRRGASAIEWRYQGETLWKILIQLTELQGTPGIQGLRGLAGSEVELREGATHIQWRYVGGESWIDLIAIADITGPAGHYTAEQIRDMLHTLMGIERLSAAKVKYDEEASVFEAIAQLTSIVNSKQKALIQERFIYDGEEGGTFTMAGVVKPVFFNVNRVPYAGKQGANYDGYDYKYSYLTNNTVITLNPGLQLMFRRNDIIDILYTL